ncbi:MAG: UDP-N-acetylmuramoyl-L-alanine--D-glutamate ligase [Thermoanaerobacteraceae bacterium]|nr:UDP-N-acetylmuramoyl-L-alanine--D-glutamate ligase [Thermoanaerobacteraceae bacterium]
MNWQEQRVLVVGMARSGVAAALELAERGAVVTACDLKREAELTEAVARLRTAGVRVHAGGYPRVAGNFDLVIPSPGVPATTEPLREAVAHGIPVWSELEVAYRFSRGKVVAVTGTNGKTTTTALIGRMFSDAGLPVVVAGNIGVPLISEVKKTTPQHTLVVEVSSFQLEWVHKFQPRVAVILNITPDHLDRHGTIENYTAAKAKIFQQQTSLDYTVLNYDDERVKKLAAATPGQVIFFSRQHKLEAGVFVRDGVITIKQEQELPVVAAKEVAIKGGHNLENALAATAAGWTMGLSPEEIRQTLKTFPGVEHRLEHVRTLDGVKYINDSKGTNPDASIKALEAYPNPVILIAGGKNKGSDFGEFAKMVKQKAREVILLGEAAGELDAALQKEQFTNIHHVDNYREAVSLARKLARPGDIVLLSPACASWDMFNSYEERGELFKQLVNELT